MIPYFTEDYWAFAEATRSARQIDAELAFLLRALQQSPGRRVVDLGCGLGHHAIGLSQAGFSVTGLDISPRAIGQARRRSTDTGVDVRWERVDLMSPDPWPVDQVDAAICIRSFGWGSDADQRRLLRRLRHSLVPGGLLMLLQHTASGALSDTATPPSRAIGAALYGHQLTYDPVTGRQQSCITISLPGEEDRVLVEDLRIYSTVELVTMIRQAGFAVAHVDTDLLPKPPAPSSPATVRIVARALPTVPSALAVASWRTPEGDGLDLRYEPDEADWLDPAPADVWTALLRDEGHGGAEAAEHYPVDDPYGAERAADVVAQYFDCPMPPHHLTFGAGVTSLLRNLCQLADGGLVVAPQLVHPDLSVWAMADGSEIRLLDEPVTAERLIAEIRTNRPSLVHLDRPTFAGDLISVSDLEAVGRAASSVGATLLIDESPASYFGPAGSIVPLIHRLDNLIVLRSFTKVYSWGGLRVGFAVASEGVAARVRELVPPMQVGELAFRAVLRLMAAGDVFGRLRVRVAVTKPIMIAQLQALNLDVIEGHAALPWVLVRDYEGATSRMLNRHGIHGLRLVPCAALCSRPPELLHLSVPLSDERMTRFRRLLKNEMTMTQPACASGPDNPKFISPA